MSTEVSPPAIFVSHAHDNKALVDELTEFLRASMVVQANRIRCTSVPGHKLGFGRHFSDLRDEIKTCKAFLAFLTPQAQGKPNVLMELGAAWAHEKPLFALLTRGVPFSATGFESPRHHLSMEASDFEADLKEWLKDLANAADLDPQDEPIRDRARNRFVKALQALAQPLAPFSPTPPSPRAQLRKRIQAWSQALRDGQKVKKPHPFARPEQIGRYMEFVAEAKTLDASIKAQVLSASVSDTPFGVLGVTDTPMESLIAAADELTIFLEE